MSSGEASDSPLAVTDIGCHGQHYVGSGHWTQGPSPACEGSTSPAHSVEILRQRDLMFQMLSTHFTVPHVLHVAHIWMVSLHLQDTHFRPQPPQSLPKFFWWFPTLALCPAAGVSTLHRTLCSSLAPSLTHLSWLHSNTWLVLPWVYPQSSSHLKSRHCR